MVRFGVWLLFCSLMLSTGCVVAQPKATQKKIQQLLQQAYLRLEEGELVPATGLFREILLLDSNQVQAHLGLAQSEAQRKQHGKAVSHFEKARSLKPNAVASLLPIYAEELAGNGEFQ